MNVLEDFDNRKGGTGEKRFLEVVGRIKEADVLVHVEDVAMRKTFNIFVHSDDLLEVLVLAIAKDGVVDDDTVDGIILIGGENLVFEIVSVGLAKLKLESAGEMLSDQWTR